MKKMKNRLWTAGCILMATLMGGCQQEAPVGGLELVVEGMGGGATKMTVGGTCAYWQQGDSVSINGTLAKMTVDGERAYVSGSFDYEDDYCVVFPGGLLREQVGGRVTVDMPSEYRYATEYVDGVGVRQVLDAPMAYYGWAADGKVKMKHLTGAMNIVVSGPSGLVVDCITVGTTQHRVMSGEMQFDLSDIDAVGSSATNVVANNTVKMIFSMGQFSTGTVQVPIPVLDGDVNFWVKVEGHVEGTKHTFLRTQTTGGHLGRGVLATVAVDMNEGADGVVTSTLFAEAVHNGVTYYEIGSPREFQLMSDAIWGTVYREDGDEYSRDWQYEGAYYREANYYVVCDLDMTGYPVGTIVDYNGTFNGGNHSINNLRVTPRRSRESTVGNYGGLFCFGEDVVVAYATFNNLQVGTSGEDEMYVGSIFGRAARKTYIQNVVVNNFSMPSRTYYNLSVGGFVGRESYYAADSRVVIKNCRLTFAAGQTIRAARVLTVGGIASPYRFASQLSVPLTMMDVSVDFNGLCLEGGNSCYFGGVLGSGSVATNISAENSIVRGGVTLLRENGGYVWAGKISTYQGAAVDSLTGVDAENLSITIQ